MSVPGWSAQQHATEQHMSSHAPGVGGRPGDAADDDLRIWHPDLKALEFQRGRLGVALQEIVGDRELAAHGHSQRDVHKVGRGGINNSAAPGLRLPDAPALRWGPPGLALSANAQAAVCVGGAFIYFALQGEWAVGAGEQGLGQQGQLAA